MFAQHSLMEVLVKLFQKYVGYWGSAPNRATQSAKLLYFIRIQGQRPWSSTADVEILFLCGCQLYFILFKLSCELYPHRFGDSRVFHTYFLPKRERKYQRKRFRAAARTPRGHRSCSALSALEMRRRLQRCYCSSQNEALAPLMWRKTHVFGCSRGAPHPHVKGNFDLCGGRSKLKKLVQRNHSLIRGGL